MDTGLDCESLASTIDSLSSLLKIETSELTRRLEQFDFEVFLSENQWGDSHIGEILAEHALGIKPASLPVPETVYWFHGTRVPRNTTFDEGLIPHPDLVEKITTYLKSLADKASVSLLRSKNVDFQFGFKMSEGEEYNRGPWGVLVRDVFFKPKEFESAEYLSKPEIVNDICKTYERGDIILSLYKAETRPCIVKFRSILSRSDVVPPAIAYVYFGIRNDEMSTHTNTCYDGEGKPIPRTDIVKIEWPDISDEGKLA